MTQTEERGFFDRDFTYIFTPKDGVLTPNQNLNGQVSIDVDADFWIATYYKIGDAVFEVMITDSDGYQFSNVPEPSAAIGIQSNPNLVGPAHRVPAGGRIQLAITELGGATADCQIMFKGWKRFPEPQGKQ